MTLRRTGNGYAALFTEYNNKVALDELTVKYRRVVRRRALLIVNPKAGNMRAMSIIAPTVKALSESGYESIVFTTESCGDAAVIAAEYGAESELLICSGGDGTVNEAVRGVMELEKEQRPVIGCIPMGSTNDFAGAIGLPKQRKKQIETAISGVPTEVDVGRFNGRYYAYLASFGAFTDISYSTSQEYKNVFGFLAYIGSGVNSIANIHPIKALVLTDTRMIEGEFAFVSISNTPSIAGVINYARKNRVDLNDGLFEVMLIDYPKNAMELSRIAHALSTGDFSCDLMHCFLCSEVRFIFDKPVKWMLDGELAQAGHEVLIENIHSAVRLMLPKG